MKKSVNLLSDVDPLLLSRDMNAISKSRQVRSSEADFESYLNFIETTSSMFGFSKRKKQPTEKSESPLL